MVSSPLLSRLTAPGLASQSIRAAAAAARPPPPRQVVSGFDQLAGADCMVEAFPPLGLSVVSAPEPLHYYSLFSHTIGADVVVRWRGHPVTPGPLLLLCWGAARAAAGSRAPWRSTRPATANRQPTRCQPPRS